MTPELPAGTAGTAAKVYEPKKLPNVRFDRDEGTVTDLDTGDRLAITSGHAGGVGQFGLSNESSGVIAGGSYYWWSTPDVAVYDVIGLTSPSPGLPYLSRSEFDIARLAELFRARLDTASPNHGRKVLVVDSRPETAAEIDRQTGNRSVSE